MRKLDPTYISSQFSEPCDGAISRRPLGFVIQQTLEDKNKQTKNNTSENWFNVRKV